MGGMFLSTEADRNGQNLSPGKRVESGFKGLEQRTRSGCCDG